MRPARANRDRDGSASAVRFTGKEREFVFGVAMKYMRDEEKANDVAQEAMLLAYRHRGSFRGDSRPTTWLYRIAATTALMHLRKDRRAPLLQSLSTEEAEPTPSEPREHHASPEEVWASREAVQMAEKRLAQMGDKYGRVFAMRFAEGYSESEIAHALKLSVAAVKTRAYRARATLKKELESAFTPSAQAA